MRLFVQMLPNTQNWTPWSGIFRAWFLFLMAVSLGSAAHGAISTWQKDYLSAVKEIALVSESVDIFFTWSVDISVCA